MEGVVHQLQAPDDGVVDEPGPGADAGGRCMPSSGCGSPRCAWAAPRRGRTGLCQPLSERRYSGKFNLRVGESLRSRPAIEAADEQVSINQLVIRRLPGAETVVKSTTLSGRNATLKTGVRRGRPSAGLSGGRVVRGGARRALLHWWTRWMETTSQSIRADRGARCGQRRRRVAAARRNAALRSGASVL